MSWVCLMYHDIVAGDPGGGGGPERFSVSRRSFEEMLTGLTAAGFVGCRLDEALKRSSQSRIAITFDDGTAGQFENALPALLAHRMTATFFVTTDWVGQRGYMTWDQLRQVVASGMSVQSHTRTHPHLSELDATGLRTELTTSKARLDDALGQNTTQIALPGGNAPRRRWRHLLGDAGYSIVATSRWGANTEPSERASSAPIWVRRCTAPRSVSADLAARIANGDWRLTLTRYPREAALNATRAVLGASRYHRWRRQVLDLTQRDRT